MLHACKVLCGARRPPWQDRPEDLDERLPCARQAHHDGPHADADGRTWIITTAEVRYALSVVFAAEALRDALTEELAP
ncbi:hypothetical protein QNO07_22490 [Streptomyces sp. 549]|uniref:hypothetical protein n=1 Tax=Streptomyces sp. 549 TaxID=3049076 RepID=UPI0024C4368E|nr:hypothetical protein [Streptomyces sp. 549]MDK1476153.1 hypothetical protein [Streptomyces sp. 549]